MLPQVGIDGRYLLWALGCFPTSWREPIQSAFIGLKRAVPHVLVNKGGDDPGVRGLEEVKAQ
jgi:hypothetical protein